MAGQVMTRSSMDALEQDDYAGAGKKPAKKKAPAKKGAKGGKAKPFAKKATAAPAPLSRIQQAMGATAPSARC